MPGFFDFEEEETSSVTPSQSEESPQSTSSVLSADSNSDDAQSLSNTSSDTSAAQEIVRVEIDGDVVEAKTPEAKSLATELSETRQEIAEYETELGSVDAVQKEMNAEIERIRREAQDRINQISMQRSKMEEEVREKRRALRAKRDLMWSKERQFRQALENERAAVAFKLQAAEFDKITTGHYWREFALEHQIEGAKKLATARRALLGDKMGLGKSLTSIIWLDMIKARKVLIIVPADVLRNFEREIAHWAPHRNVFTLGKISKGERQFVLSLLKKQDDFVVTMNYEAWRKDKSLLEDLKALRFDTIICDEGHTMKNTSTSAFKGVESIVLAENSCPRCSGEIGEVRLDANTYFERCVSCDWDSHDRNYNAFDKCSIKNVLPMTGTPILNKPQDLFAMLRLIDPVNFQREKYFLQDYCDFDYYSQRWTFRPGGLERLTKQLGSKYVARDRQSAGVVIPPQDVQVHDIEFDVDMYPKQWKIISDLREHAGILLESGEAMKMTAIIALITRQRQANVWPGGITLKDAKGDVIFSVADEVIESMKMDKAQELLTEAVENGERAVLMSQFKVPLDELARRLNDKGIRTVCYHGDTPENIRDQVKLDFDRKYCDEPGYEKKWDVVLANYKTGGQGLNFTGASQMIILDEEWNPGKRDQGYARIDRMGQTQETVVHVLRIQKSIDTWMADLIQEKEDMIGGFESSMDLQQKLRDAIQNGEA